MIFTEDYIIIPKKKEDEEPSIGLIHRIEDKNKCMNCSEIHKYVLSFGLGVNTVKIKLCRSCLEEYKNRLDKEFGNTFWGTVGKVFKAKDREIKVSYYDT